MRQRRYSPRVSHVGVRSGKLLAVERVEEHLPSGKVIPKYRCKCDCGKEVVISGNNLICGETKSCGCLTQQKYEPGFKFYMLTVNSYDEQTKRYQCTCDCGKPVTVRTPQLLDKPTISCSPKRHCGCTPSIDVPKYKDLIGQVFARLTVIGYAGKTRSGKLHRWLCHCICGKDIVIRGSSLVRGTTKSCGCLKTETLRKCRKDQTEVLLHRLLKVYETNAKRRNLLFDLAEDSFSAVVNSPCHYCGDLPTRAYTRKDRAGGFSIVVNGIDRIDNNIGYVKDNIVPCCTICNRAKSNMSSSAWLEYLDQVVAWRSK